MTTKEILLTLQEKVEAKRPRIHLMQDGINIDLSFADGFVEAQKEINSLITVTIKELEE